MRVLSSQMVHKIEITTEELRFLSEVLNNPAWDNETDHDRFLREQMLDEITILLSSCNSQKITPKDIAWCETCKKPRGGNPECSVCWDEPPQ